jgi:hypothetical protein
MTIGFLDGHVDWYVPGHQPSVPREMFTCADGLTENWAHTFAEKRVRLPSMIRYDRFAVSFLYPVLAFLPAILAFFRPAAPLKSSPETTLP